MGGNPVGLKGDKPMSEIYRQIFVSLNRDNRYQSHYIVLLDGTFEDEFWADSDDKAIEQFKEMYVA